MIMQAFKYKLREKASQAASLRRFAGCRRFVWNKALAEQQARHARGEKYTSFAGMCKWITVWRNEPELAFLKETPVHALQDAVRALDGAFKRFFEKTGGYPNFKSKREQEGFRETDPACFAVDAATNRVRLPKIGWIRFRQSRPLLGTVRTISVRREADGWYVAIQTQREGVLPCAAIQAIGLDRGVTYTLAGSDGRLVPALNAHKSKLARLARYQRSCARKQAVAKKVQGLKPHEPWPAGHRPAKSNRLRKAQQRVSRLHVQIKATRQTWLHAKTRELAENFAMVAIEDLRIANMTASASGSNAAPGRRVKQKSGLNRAILDQGWGELARQLEYKLAWRDGILVKVPPAYTSQRCAACGVVDARSRKRLNFLCTACGHEDHADLNAAKNILAAGHAVLAGALRGEPIERGGRRSKAADEALTYRSAAHAA